MGETEPHDTERAWAERAARPTEAGWRGPGWVQLRTQAAGARDREGTVPLTRWHLSSAAPPPAPRSRCTAASRNPTLNGAGAGA